MSAATMSRTRQRPTRGPRAVKRLRAARHEARMADFRERERMAYGPVSWHRKRADALKACEARNGGPAIVSPLAKATADVVRLRAQLARAEAKAVRLGAPFTGHEEEVCNMPKTTSTKTAQVAGKGGDPKRAKTALAAKITRESAAPTHSGAEPLLSGPKLAEQVIREAGAPLHISVIAERVLAIDAARPIASRAFKGKTPKATIGAKLTMSDKAGGVFVKVAPGTFGLRSRDAVPASATKVGA